MSEPDIAAIEAALLGHPGVDGCVVRSADRRLVARAVLGPEDSDGGRLVAHVTAVAGTSPADLRAHLADRLPGHRLPDDIRVTRSNRPTYVRPSTVEQVRVCAVWAEVLKVDRVGLHDSFLALGGDSLQALRIIARLRGATGKPLTVRDVLLSQTPERLAGVLATRQAARESTVEDESSGTEHPLSAHQTGVYFQWLMAPESPYYSYQGVLHLTGPLDEDRLRLAWRLLLTENPSLLVRFASREGNPVQHIPHWMVELGPTIDAAERFAEDADALARQPFDLTREPLLRTTLYRFGPEDHRLLVTMHEILLDGWGALVFFGRLGEVYAALAERPDLGPDSRRRELFTRYLRWQERHHDSAEVRQAGQHWAKSLAGTLPVLDLPTDRPRPAFPSFRGGLIEAVLPTSSTRAVHTRCAELGITPFMLLLGAFSLVLTYYAGDDEVVVGTPMANRDTEEQVEVVGFLLNMLPLRVSTDPDRTVADFLGAVRRVALDGLAASDYPFASILRGLANVPRTLARSPVFQVMLNMLNYPVRASRHDGVDFRFVETDTGFTKYDVALYVQPHGEDDLLLQLAYQTDLFDRDTADRLLASVLAAVTGLTGSPDRRVGDLDLLPDGERMLLDRFTTGG